MESTPITLTKMPRRSLTPTKVPGKKTKSTVSVNKPTSMLEVITATGKMESDAAKVL